MVRNHFIVLAISLLVATATSQQAELIDFTYSHVLPNVEETEHKG